MLLKIVPPVVWGATLQPPVPVEGIRELPAVLTMLPLKVCAIATPAHSAIAPATRNARPAFLVDMIE